MNLYLKLPTGERLEIADSIDIYLNEKIKLSSDSRIHVSGDCDTLINNNGHEADVKVVSPGKHVLKVHHGILTRPLHVYVKINNEYIQATHLNITASQPV